MTTSIPAGAQPSSMTTPTAPSSPSSTRSLVPPPKPPHNPTPLSATQEAAVRSLYHERVRGYCADEIRDFAKCAAGRTFSTAWACRTPRRAMNACMLVHATPEEEDAARRAWFAQGQQRVAEREREREMKLKHEAFEKEWWRDYGKEEGKEKRA